MRNYDCYFYSKEGYCEHSNKLCNKVCRDAIRKLSNLSPDGHYQQYWRKKELRTSFIFKWFTLIISIIAIIISIFTYLNENKNISTNQKDTNQRIGSVIKANPR